MDGFLGTGTGATEGTYEGYGYLNIFMDLLARLANIIIAFFNGEQIEL